MRFDFKANFNSLLSAPVRPSLLHQLGSGNGPRLELPVHERIQPKSAGQLVDPICVQGNVGAESSIFNSCFPILAPE
jgi:hypothetical protein